MAHEPKAPLREHTTRFRGARGRESSCPRRFALLKGRQRPPWFHTANTALRMARIHQINDAVVVRFACPG